MGDDDPKSATIGTPTAAAAYETGVVADDDGRERRRSIAVPSPCGR
jgi:hypothetical protein